MVSSRADRVPATAPASVRFRAAVGDDARRLAELERDANLVALAHVFPPTQFAFPFDDVCARWAQVLADPACHVDVVDRPGPAGLLDGFVAYDRARLRHLAVRPDRFGDGLAAQVLARAETGMRALGARSGYLWVLVANRRARRFYERHGWQPTRHRQACEWAPYPVETQYRRDLAGDQR